MKTWKISAICILLTFLCLFSSIGYAAFTEPLRINGTAKIDIPSGLFITNISTDSVSYTDKNDVSFLQYSTTVDSTISRTNWNTGSVTYRITVLNNTELTYSYRGLYYQSRLDGYNGNQYVSTSSGKTNIGVECSLAKATAEQKKVAPGDTLTFTVKYTLGNNLNAGLDFKTLINYQFGINVDGEREALEVIEDKFLNILNTTSTYRQLIDVLDNKFDGRQEWTSNYIGNVKGSSSEDSVAVNTLFAGQLQITVGKDQMDATVLIKHENLDGNTQTGDDYTLIYNQYGEITHAGCEMTLYLTIDPLSSAGRYVPVYVVVFTCDKDDEGNRLGDWYRIGSTYAGTANVVTYDGGNGTGSFVTDNWRADAATYPLIDGYSYTIDGERYSLGAYSISVAESDTIKNIVSAKDARANNTLKTLLDDARRLADNRDYAGVGIDIINEELEKIYTRFADFYTVDENGVHTVDPDLTVAQVSPAIVDLYRVVNDALVKIDAIQ